MDPAAEAARFVREQVRPHLEEWEASARYPREAVRASGLTGLFAPAETGGLDLSYPDGMAVFEELGRGDAALAFSMSMHNAVAAAVARAGTGELLERWGARLVRGEALGGFSLTEPHAGSDAAAITARATETAHGWRVTGRKAWVSLAGEADLFLVVCKTSDEPGHRDVAMLAVEREGAGVSFPTLYRKVRAAFLPIGEMALEDAPGYLLAPPGQGLRAALGAIDVARCDVAAIANGLHAEALELALRYGRDRKVFGKRVIDHQGIQWALADVETDLVAGRLLTRAAAERLGTPEGSVVVSHAKRFCPDAALRAAIVASEVLGAYGWLEDHPLARFIDLAKMLQVVDGTTEIQRVVIARDLLRRAETL
ncbi:MAG TPA: acyl-CoA dehydrogenase family protein [Actinomycetota bacterium]|jgi:alkylation response protein AidB-like acyl-CoA dehydrogenase|nr:acyl-CoA dehydrogenase family protein [Actinomycetota bacterium]